MTGVLQKLEALLAGGQDGAPLRFALASGYFKGGELDAALEHAIIAVQMDADYSAAWRVLGQIQAARGMVSEARATFERGIAVAEGRGDMQVAREMRVFLKRLQNQQEGLQDDACQ